MGTVATARRKIIIAHICSRCGSPVVQECTLFADGRANAFFHEKDMAEEAREIAFTQAYKDIAACRVTPRRLGSTTEVETNRNRMWAFYQVEKLDVPCGCGHIEPWQERKKSLWNPVDGTFNSRAQYPNVPLESRPALLDSQQAVDAWFADPKNMGRPEAGAEVEAVRECPSWECSGCGTSNLGRAKTCQRCGVTRQWSDAKAAKKK